MGQITTQFGSLFLPRQLWAISLICWSISIFSGDDGSNNGINKFHKSYFSFSRLCYFSCIIDSYTYNLSIHSALKEYMMLRRKAIPLNCPSEWEKKKTKCISSSFFLAIILLLLFVWACVGPFTKLSYFCCLARFWICVQDTKNATN